MANSPFTVLNFRRELLINLLSRGHKVTVACPQDCDLMKSIDIVQDFRTLGVSFFAVKLNRSGLNPLKEFYSLISILRIILRNSPDVILNYTIKPTIYSSIAGKLSGVKLIYSNVTGLGYAFTGSGWKVKLIYFIVKCQYKIALACNTRVFFQNPDDIELFVNSNLIEKNKPVLINGSGVDTTVFKRDFSLRSKFDFLYVGRMLEDKGVCELLSAAKRIKEKYPKVTISLAGPYDKNPSAISSELINRYVDSGVIRYLGNVDNIIDCYQQHGVFILPSYREGTPRSSLEAMAMSMPIITTDVPGCRETVEHMVNGILIPSKNENALFDAMEKFILFPHLIEKMGRIGRNIAVDKYDIKIVNQSILNVIE
ncbi:glycosyltransferase family 4 protein [Vibrio vulnificus]|nr:glycosyltransferase family 4 protein [Vibrio vulnificus]